MDATKIERLKKAAHVSVTAAEVADMHEKLAASSCLCQTICEWIIKKAAGAGTCAAGEAALTGIFTLAEVVFFPEGEEILVPLEAVVDVAWGVTCADVGIAAIGANADKYALEWCQKAGMCK